MQIFGYEIIVKKTIKKTKGFSSRRWTKDETELMFKLKEEGKRTEEIAKALNRTPAAILVRISAIKTKRI